MGLGIKIIGFTENKNDERPIEIFNWICKNKPNMCIILDDRHLECENFGYKIKECFIKTTYLMGLTTECVRKAIFMLNSYNLIHNIHTLKILRKSHNIYQIPRNFKKKESETLFLPILEIGKIA